MLHISNSWIIVLFTAIHHDPCSWLVIALSLIISLVLILFIYYPSGYVVLEVLLTNNNHCQEMRSWPLSP